MDHHAIKILMIEDLCKSLSCLVGCEIEKEQRKATTAKRSGDSRKAEDDDDSTTTRIVNLSKEIMESLDTGSASDLSPEELDPSLRRCLFDVYHMPSVINGFQTETVAFYSWWRRRMKGWIRAAPTSDVSGDTVTARRRYSYS